MADAVIPLATTAPVSASPSHLRLESLVFTIEGFLILYRSTDFR
jgi:hypothetical protein